MATTNLPHPTDTQQHCPECDYNLTGAVEGRCPWCGWVIDERVLTTIALDRSVARQVGAALACAVCGAGTLIGVASLVWHSPKLSLRDGLAAVGVLVASVGHIGLAGLIVSGKRQWPIYRPDAGLVFRFAGWFSVILGVIGATELLRSRDVQGVPVAATFEFALAAVFYALPGAALLVMRMVTFRNPSTLGVAPTIRRTTEKEMSDRAPFSVDVIGRFEKSQVITVLSEQAQSTSAAVQADIDQAWSSARALADADDLILFDAPLIRLCNASIHDGVLQLKCGKTSYRTFVGTNMNPDFVARADRTAHRANPLGISASIITRDGFIAYGRRGRRVAFQAGYVHPFGGMVDTADQNEDGSVDLFGAMMRELTEETGLAGDDIADMIAVGLVRDRRLGQPELVFDVSVHCGRRELEARFDPARSDGEHTEIEFLCDDPEAAIPSLSRLDKITPIAEAAYLLHGNAYWGVEWYEQTCLIRYGELPPKTPSSDNVPQTPLF